MSNPEDVIARLRERMGVKRQPSSEVDTTTGGVEFVRPLQDASHLTSRKAIDPNAITRQDTAHGQVVKFGGWCVYYGTCQRCQGLVHTRRRPGPGRWPSNCSECTETNETQHQNAARKRMAGLRRKRYADRDAQFAARGWEPVRQGVRHSTTEPKYADDLDDYLG